ncbi:MAG: hypothetical protein M1812_000561 [Candelaria pacifica]|nr:MAG: hypothetical protein M1812_000561 [Candelaria pacifica]
MPLAKCVTKGPTNGESSQSRDSDTAVKRHASAGPEERSSKRPRISIKELESEYEEERSLEEVEQREWEELQRKKEEAKTRINAKREALKKSIEALRQSRQEKARLNEELRRHVRDLEEGNL